MVALARRRIADQHRVGYFHVYSRCVRGARLCGKHPESGNNYDHRREWIVKRLDQLCGLFAIDVGFYAVMPNHLHLVLRLRPDLVRKWGRKRVARAWLTATRLAKAKGDAMPEVDEALVNELAKDKKRIQTLKKRLAKMSWFVGFLCENIARRANEEDGVKGHFWESRFKSRCCTDEASLLVCGIYVDLNQIRAGESGTLRGSIFTSASPRVQWLEALIQGRPPTAAPWLAELTLREGGTPNPAEADHSQSGRRASDLGMIPIELEHYMALLDWTGHQTARNKKGKIPDHLAPLIEQMGLRHEFWLDLLMSLDAHFGYIMGRAEALAEAAARMGQSRIRGMKASRQAYR